jgi:hypothetical protein
MKSFLNIIFLFQIIFAHESFLAETTHAGSALFITGLNGKSIISFNIKNAMAMMTLGLVDNEFVLASGDYQYITAKKNKAVTIKGESILVNTIKTKGSVRYNGTPQWRLAHHDSWNKNFTSNDWSIDTTTECGDYYTMIGGHCQVSDKEISKTYTLTKHKEVKVEALYHFLGKWDSNTGYLKADNKYIWTHRCNSATKPSIRTCGPKIDVCKIAVAVQSTIKHNDETLKITFGSTLDGDACDKSYGVSDIRIYIK